MDITQISIDYISVDYILIGHNSLLYFLSYFHIVPPSVLPVSDYIIGLFNESITIAFTITDVVSPVNLLKILWQVKPLNSDTFRSIIPTSPDRLSLTIPNVQLSDRGMYKMSAENEAGADEAIVTVNVLGKF